MAELHGTLEIKTLRAPPACGRDFAASFWKGVAIEFLAHAEFVEKIERVREQRLADLETREGFLLAKHDATARACEQDRGGGARGPAPDDCDVCM